MLTPFHRPTPLTVDELADFTASAPKDDITVIHRGYGQHHLHDRDDYSLPCCWCDPLLLTYNDIHGPNQSRTERLLAQFFAVH